MQLPMFFLLQIYFSATGHAVQENGSNGGEEGPAAKALRRLEQQVAAAAEEARTDLDDARE